jgi:predicted metal-binding membrane protein
MRLARTRGGLVALLLVLAAAGWWSTIEQMEGMDHGPWTGLGTLGWFLGVWIVMMAAMMLPSAIPAVTMYAGLAKDRTSLAPLFFVTGYLAVWAAAGLAAFGVAFVGGRVTDGFLAWERGGRWAAGATLLLAAAYQLTPIKDACLARCRVPIAFLLGSWRPGRRGGFRMGLSHGAWCAGCCWALMAALFALGVMSIAWTALVAALVAVEKILPWRRVGTWGTSALLAAFGVVVLTAPELLPGLTLPGAGPMSMGG